MPRKKRTIIAIYERLPKESWQAFEAFVTYRDMGANRSIRLVAQKIGKNPTLMSKWSRQHRWPERAHAYDDHIDSIKREARESVIAKQYRGVMTSNEVLEGISAHSDGDITDLLNENGEFDLADIKRRGLGRLIKRVTRHSNGSIASIELYDAKDSKELMGRYYRLWDRGMAGPAFEDDKELALRVLAKLAGTEPHLLPPANPLDVDGELVLDSETKVELEKEQ
jgi:hypothetical protein